MLRTRDREVECFRNRDMSIAFVFVVTGGGLIEMALLLNYGLGSLYHTQGTIHLQHPTQLLWSTPR